MINRILAGLAAVWIIVSGVGLISLVVMIEKGWILSETGVIIAILWLSVPSMIMAFLFLGGIIFFLIHFAITGEKL